MLRRVVKIGRIATVKSTATHISEFLYFRPSWFWDDMLIGTISGCTGTANFPRSAWPVVQVGILWICRCLAATVVSIMYIDQYECPLIYIHSNVVQALLRYVSNS